MVSPRCHAGHWRNLVAAGVVALALIAPAAHGDPDVASGSNTPSRADQYRTERPTPAIAGTEAASPLVVEIKPAAKEVEAIAEKKPPVGRIFELEPDAWVALFTLALSISTVLLWLETRRLARDAKAQHQISNRAFVYLSELSVDKILDGRTGRVTTFRITPMWKNSGNTPTEDGEVNTTWIPDVVPDDLAYGSPAQIIFVGPNATVGSQFIDIPARVIDSVRDFETNVYIWGYVKYRDVFKGTPPHTTKFLFKMNTHRSDSGDLWMGFVPHGPYNGASSQEGGHRRAPLSRLLPSHWFPTLRRER